MLHDPELSGVVSESALVLDEATNDFGETLQVMDFVRGKQPDDRLKLSCVRKVSPTGVYLPSNRWVPTTPNSFGLPPGETCPGKTDFCNSCYAFGSIRSKGVKEMLDHNLNMLSMLEGVNETSAYLSEMIARFYEAAMQNGISDQDMIFRIHWSGDFYSLEYAEAWAKTIKQFPNITFWAFTRSFRGPVDVVPILDGIENLVLYLSTDKGNISDIPGTYDHLPRANSAVDVIRAEQLVRDGRRTITCPENLDRLGLMQDGRGACVRCRACLRGLVDVNFVTSGKHDATPSRYASGIPERPIDVSAVTIRQVDRKRYVTNNR